MTSSFFKIGRELRPPVPQPSPTGRRLEVGSVIGDYRLVRLIAQGGMGQVWESEQISMHRKVALKFVRPERVTSRYLRYFEREARAGGRLTHPDIVTVFGFGKDDGVAWIAMEFVPGCWTLRHSLDQKLVAGPLPEDHDRAVAEFISRAARAMQAAHEDGVIHRDLKPQNILVTPDNRPKITDFGLARLLDESGLSETGDVVGTYAYMSPEQVRAKRTGLDHRTDIFSLGVVLFEMLTLQRPFHGDTTHQVAEQILEQDPPELRQLRSRIPRDLDLICRKALRKDPNKRFRSMAEFGEELERFLAGEPTRARPPSWLERTAKWIRRHPATSTLFASVLVALIAVGGLGVRIARQNEALRSSNTALTTMTERSAEHAREAERRTSEVYRLALLHDHERLVSDAGELWPPLPDRIPAMEAWIQRARQHCAELEDLRGSRDALRRRALPYSDAERRRDRASHPGTPELDRLTAELASRRAVLEGRRNGAPASAPDVDWDAYPASAPHLLAMAAPFVRPDRSSYGDEALGVALLERALELASPEELAEVCGALADGYFAVGRDGEALDMAYLAADEASQTAEAGYRAAFDTLRGRIEAATTPAALTAEAEALEVLEATLEELRTSVETRRTWTFPGDAEGRSRSNWWHAQLQVLIERIEGLADPATGLLSDTGVHPEHGWSVPKRLATALDLRAELEGEAPRRVRWDGALPHIEESVPGALDGPRADLVPLGKDPDSGLWEFWHPPSGTEPRRNAGGRLELDDGSGLVFVLLPGGVYHMGAQSTDPRGHNFDPQAGYHESPVRLTHVETFFLSKYEMTQGQWLRLVGSNPSQYAPDGLFSHLGLDLTHPVEQVSWYECMEHLPRFGLGLPTQAQWEYAARGGTTTVWWTGDSPAALEGAANLADEASARTGTPWGRNGLKSGVDDGYPNSSPVDEFRANPFGLHGVCGNVAEWCLDHLTPLADGDPNKVVRGGDFSTSSEELRSAKRMITAPEYKVHTFGVRPVLLGER